MERHGRHHDETARNPQRRPVPTTAAGQRVPTEGNDDGSGAAFPRYQFNRYRQLGTEDCPGCSQASASRAPAIGVLGPQSSVTWLPCLALVVFSRLIGERPVLLVLLPVHFQDLLDERNQLFHLQAEMGSLQLQVFDRLLDLGRALQGVMREPLA